MIYRESKDNDIVRLLDLDEATLAQSPALRSLLDLLNPIYRQIEKDCANIDNFSRRDGSFRNYLKSDDPKDSEYMRKAVNKLYSMLNDIRDFIGNLKVDAGTKMLIEPSYGTDDLVVKNPKHARPSQRNSIVGFK